MAVCGTVVVPRCSYLSALGFLALLVLLLGVLEIVRLELDHVPHLQFLLKKQARIIYIPNSRFG